MANPHASIEDGELDAVVTWHNHRPYRSPRELELEPFIDLVARSGARLP